MKTKKVLGFVLAMIVIFGIGLVSAYGDYYKYEKKYYDDDWKYSSKGHSYMYDILKNGDPEAREALKDSYYEYKKERKYYVTKKPVRHYKYEKCYDRDFVQCKNYPRSTYYDNDWGRVCRGKRL